MAETALAVFLAVARMDAGSAVLTQLELDHSLWLPLWQLCKKLSLRCTDLNCIGKYPLQIICLPANLAVATFGLDGGCSTVLRLFTLASLISSELEASALSWPLAS